MGYKKSKRIDFESQINELWDSLSNDENDEGLLLEALANVIADRQYMGAMFLVGRIAEAHCKKTHDNGWD